MNVENRTLFEGDNLHILRGLDTKTIDLIYREKEKRTDMNLTQEAIKDC